MIMIADIVWKLFFVSLVGGALSLDRTAAFQVMLSRPIVTAPVTGYIFGDAMTGLLIGGVLELLFIGGLPVGGHIPPHESMMTVIVTSISLMARQSSHEAGFDMLGIYGANILFASGFAILFALPMDAACKKVDAAARIFNMRFFNDALSDLEKGFIKHIAINNLKGLGAFFILNFLTLFVLTFAGALFVYAVLPALPAAVVVSLPLACVAAVLSGLSSAYSTFYSSGSKAAFLAATFFGIAAAAVAVR